MILSLTIDFIYHTSSDHNSEFTAQNYVAQLCVFLPPTAGVLPFYLSAYQMWNHSSYIVSYSSNPDYLMLAGMYILFKAEMQSSHSDE